MLEWRVRGVTIEVIKWGDPRVSYREMVRVRGSCHITR